VGECGDLPLEPFTKMPFALERHSEVQTGASHNEVELNFCPGERTMTLPGSLM